MKHDHTFMEALLLLHNLDPPLLLLLHLDQWMREALPVWLSFSEEFTTASPLSQRRSE
jgi:hypothetical protein